VYGRAVGLTHTSFYNRAELFVRSIALRLCDSVYEALHKRVSLMLRIQFVELTMAFANYFCVEKRRRRNVSKFANPRGAHCLRIPKEEAWNFKKFAHVSSRRIHPFSSHRLLI